MTRQCGSCSLCCKLMDVEEIDKHAGSWCNHCRPGHEGCTIYEARPRACREFLCQWRKSASFGDEWAPRKSGMVVWVDETRQPMVCRIMVDAGRIGRWRQEPYGRTTRAMVLAGLQGSLKYRTVATVGTRHWLVLPDRDIEITETAKAG